MLAICWDCKEPILNKQDFNHSTRDGYSHMECDRCGTCYTRCLEENHTVLGDQYGLNDETEILRETSERNPDLAFFPAE